MRSNPILFLSLIILVSLLLDFYTYKGLKMIGASIPNKTIKQIGTILYWSYSLVLYVGILYVMGNLGKTRNDDLMRTGMFFFSMSIIQFVPKLVFCVFQLLDDVNWLAQKAYHQVLSPHGTKISRSAFLTYLGAGVASIPLVGILYGIIKGKYDFYVKHQPVFLKKLPPAFHGLKVVHISDMHLGSFDKNTEAVKKGIDLINSLDADYVFFTGDLVNNYADEAFFWKDFLSSIRAKKGKFSVLGNHDYGDYVYWDSPQKKRANLEALKSFHQTIGFQLLLNESVLLEHENESIRLIGVENWGAGEFSKYGNLSLAMRACKKEECKILLSHDPSHWKQEVLTQTNIDLTLSGHTHGMQFGVDLGSFKYSPVQHRYPEWSGFYMHDEQMIYVNPGFGFLGFSGRVGISPEITCLTLLNKA